MSRTSGTAFGAVTTLGKIAAYIAVTFILAAAATAILPESYSFAILAGWLLSLYLAGKVLF